MKITIFAAGSRGDIQPCVVLGRALRQAGYRVCLAAPQDFAAFVQGHGLDFHPLRGDVQQVMASDTGRRFMETGGANPLQSIRAMRTLLAPVVQQMAEDAFAACRDADALICLGVLAAFGRAIADALRLPVIHIEPTPLLPSAAFAAPSWPIQRDLGGLHNRLAGRAMLQTIWLWYGPFVNDFRRSLGLAAYSGAAFYRDLRATPRLGAYSPTLIPPPADWPASAHVTGYLFLDEQPGWQPSPELQAFLDAGNPPVYVGFGSMSGRHPERLADTILAALARSSQRGVLLTGWGGQGGAEQRVRAGVGPAQLALPAHGGGGASRRRGDDGGRSERRCADGDRAVRLRSAFLGCPDQGLGCRPRPNPAAAPDRRPAGRRAHAGGD
jgi:UDP:flavonoid glycosyltransferase YjiC (YdhE family)